MLPRPDRRTLISRVLPAITLVVLSVLNGCQWCPAPTDRQTGSVNGNPTAVPTNPEPKGRPPGTQADRDRRLKEAEQGHLAMVRCLQSERGYTDGNELRCEDWAVVRDEFLGR